MRSLASLLGASLNWFRIGILLLLVVAFTIPRWELSGDETVLLLVALLAGSIGMHALVHGRAYLRQGVSVMAVVARADKTLECVADVVKDALLDWDPAGEDAPPAAPEPLPPLDPQQFVESLRGDVEATLKDVALVLNEAPDVEGIAASEARVRRCLEWLVRRSLEQGQQLRIDAAVAGRHSTPGPKGRWAQKYRRMKAAEGRLPAPPGP